MSETTAAYRQRTKRAALMPSRRTFVLAISGLVLVDLLFSFAAAVVLETKNKGKFPPRKSPATTTTTTPVYNGESWCWAGWDRSGVVPAAIWMHELHGRGRKGGSTSPLPSFPYSYFSAHPLLCQWPKKNEVGRWWRGANVERERGQRTGLFSNGLEDKPDTETEFSCSVYLISSLLQIQSVLS